MYPERGTELDNEDVIRKAKIEACRSKVSSTIFELKKLIAATRNFDNEEKDPIRASWNGDIGIVDVLVGGSICFGLVGIALSIYLRAFPLLSFPLLFTVFLGMVMSPFLLFLPPFSSAKRFLLKRMKKKFNENQDEIHVLEVQLLTLLEESRRLTKSESDEDWGVPVDDLYEWFVAADLPMSDTAREIFKYETLRNKYETLRNEKEAEESKISNSVYSSESERLQELMDNAASDYKSSILMNDQRHLIYAGRNDELNSIVDRINEISDDMEESQSGSGRNFVAEMRIPFESLCRLTELSEDTVDDGVAEDLLHKSIRMFEGRLSREEARIHDSKEMRARNEYKVIGGLLA